MTIRSYPSNLNPYPSLPTIDHQLLPLTTLPSFNLPSFAVYQLIPTRFHGSSLPNPAIMSLLCPRPMVVLTPPPPPPPCLVILPSIAPPPPSLPPLIPPPLRLLPGARSRLHCLRASISYRPSSNTTFYSSFYSSF